MATMNSLGLYLISSYYYVLHPIKSFSYEETYVSLDVKHALLYNEKALGGQLSSGKLLGPIPP